MFSVFGGAVVKIIAACLFGAIWIPLMFALGYKRGLGNGLRGLKKEDKDT